MLFCLVICCGVKHCKIWLILTAKFITKITVQRPTLLVGAAKNNGSLCTLFSFLQIHNKAMKNLWVLLLSCVNDLVENVGPIRCVSNDCGCCQRKTGDQLIPDGKRTCSS